MMLGSKQIARVYRSEKLMWNKQTEIEYRNVAEDAVNLRYGAYLLRDGRIGSSKTSVIVIIPNDPVAKSISLITNSDTTIAYDGNRFSGFAEQKDSIGAIGSLFDAYTLVTKETTIQNSAYDFIALSIRNTIYTEKSLYYRFNY